MDVQTGLIPRQLLGQRLRELRGQAGIATDDAAQGLLLASATLRGMETGDIRCRYNTADVELLAQCYGADRHTLADAERHLELESYANRIRWYEPHLLPDLLVASFEE
jgi:transcriptional regulator with XRE-family HTH domain